MNSDYDVVREALETGYGPQFSAGLAALDRLAKDGERIDWLGSQEAGDFYWSEAEYPDIRSAIDRMKGGSAPVPAEPKITCHTCGDKGFNLCCGREVPCRDCAFAEKLRTEKCSLNR